MTKRLLVKLVNISVVTILTLLSIYSLSKANRPSNNTASYRAIPASFYNPITAIKQDSVSINSSSSAVISKNIIIDNPISNLINEPAQKIKSNLVSYTSSDKPLLITLVKPEESFAQCNQDLFINLEEPLVAEKEYNSISASTTPNPIPVINLVSSSSDNQFLTLNPKIQIYPSLGTPIVQESEIDEIQAALLQFAQERNLDIYLAYDDLKGNTILINSAEITSGLSTIKFYIMLEVYKQLEEGKISKNDRVAKYGFSGTVEEALKDMMVYSSNEASGALILKVGEENINNTLRKYLGESTQSIVTHTPGYPEGGYNLVTADDQIKLLKMLCNDEILSNYKREIMNLMLQCEDYFGVKRIPGVDTIAMKTGYNPPTEYGIIGIIKAKNENSFLVSIHLYGKNNTGIDADNISNILKILIAS